MTFRRTMTIASVTALVVMGALGGHRIYRRRHRPVVDATGTDVARQATPSKRSDFGSAGRDNPGARSVAATRTGAHPERLSALVPPQPFDPAQFAGDPQAYLDVVEPGRCFQTARATGPDAVYLEPASSLAPVGKPAEEITLMVKGAPWAPVTFTAFEGGRFRENNLGSVTIRGDARGYASVHFVVPEGANGRMAVLAGSPLAVGNQTFLVDATPAVATN